MGNRWQAFFNYWTTPLVIARRELHGAGHDLSGGQRDSVFFHCMTVDIGHSQCVRAFSHSVFRHPVVVRLAV